MNIIKSTPLEVNPKLSIWDYIFEIIIHCRNDVAQIDAQTGESRTFSQLISLCNKLSQTLIAHGIKPGDVIAICSENNIDFCWILLGSLATGASCILLNPAYTPRELEHALGISQPKMVLCSVAVAKYNEKGLSPSVEVFDQMEQVHTIFVWGCKDENVPPICLKLEDTINQFLKYETILDPDIYKEDDYTSVRYLDILRENNVSHKPSCNTALILSSSGSTGLPKGVALTHTNIVAALMTSANYVNKQECALGLMPFFHAYGLVLMLMALCERAKVVVMCKFAVDSFIQTIQQYKITTLHLVPSLLVLISKKDLIIDDIFNSIHHIWTGAAPVNPNIQQAVHDKLTHGFLHHSYGLTETTFTMFTGQYRCDKPGSPGQLTPGMECKVIDQNTKEILGPNETGELCFRGPLLMVGYLRNLEATDQTIDEEGWLHSGDLGYYDNDHYFFIVDRLKEMIKYQGYQVSPTELESVLLTHSAVEDAAVAGLPDDVYGELPQAFIVKQPEAQITAQEIIDFVSGKVSPYKKLHGGVKFVDSIPKTVSGKILRRELRKFDDV